jgi:ATP-dependent DNA helicase RecQ
MGTLEKVGDIIPQATVLILENKAEIKEITKTVLVIDEAQDMSGEEYALVEALMAQNEEMRVIAVGDDDQNIYGFRGSSPEYLGKFILEKKAVKYELVDNYRSKANLVEFTNQWVETIPYRLKQIPIIAKDQGLGKVLLTGHSSAQIIKPLVEEILQTDLMGTVAVLTKTNDEALKVAGLLRQHKLPVKLIQGNEGFNLFQLYEIRYFMRQLLLKDGVYAIPLETWDKAKKQLQESFAKTSKVEMVFLLLSDFESIYPKTRYRSDFEILVSTIHKAKGKEFDQVFLLYQHGQPREEDEKRLLYVGMTRAKSLLSVHYQGNFLSGFHSGQPQHSLDNSIYIDPETLVIHLNHSDVWLDYFVYRQRQIQTLRPGEKLEIKGHECFNKTLESFETKGYTIHKVYVNWMVYWKDPEMDKEALVILPEVVLGKI